jgi:hypothetical protein
MDNSSYFIIGCQSGGLVNKLIFVLASRLGLTTPIRGNVPIPQTCQIPVIFYRDCITEEAVAS